MRKKKEIIEVEIPEIKSVRFLQNFTGSLNNYSLKAIKGDVKDIPDNVYEWIKKFKVCEDA